MAGGGSGDDGGGAGGGGVLIIRMIYGNGCGGEYFPFTRSLAITRLLVFDGERILEDTRTHPNLPPIRAMKRRSFCALHVLKVWKT